MPATAKRHFEEDLDRARQLVELADSLPITTPAERMLHDDVLRSGWMFAVGAADACFCDAYVDMVASLWLCGARQREITIPAKYNDLRVPISTILIGHPVRNNWTWRMAARSLMETKSILDLGTVKEHFNKFCEPNDKLFGDVLDDWALHGHATARVFGVTRGQYAATSGRARETQRKNSVAAMRHRFDEVIFQRRHDCIHNCDRPKTRPQSLPGAGTVRNVIRDIDFLVQRFDRHMTNEMHTFLSKLGFSISTIRQVDY